MSDPDRLGDALREIARGMVANGTTRMRMQVMIGEVEATYEVRLIKARAKCPVQIPASGPGRSRRPRQKA